MDSYNNPQPGKTYISPSLDAFNQPGRKVRIATKVIEHPDSYAFAEIKAGVVLRHRPDAKSCITAKFFEEDRGMFVLSIQGYTVATMKPRQRQCHVRRGRDREARGVHQPHPDDGPIPSHREHARRIRLVAYHVTTDVTICRQITA